MSAAPNDPSPPQDSSAPAKARRAAVAGARAAADTARVKAEALTTAARAATAKRAAARTAAARVAAVKAAAEKAATAKAEAAADRARESAAKVAAVKANTPRTSKKRTATQADAPAPIAVESADESIEREAEPEPEAEAVVVVALAPEVSDTADQDPELVEQEAGDAAAESEGEVIEPEFIEPESEDEAAESEPDPEDSEPEPDSEDTEPEPEPDPEPDPESEPDPELEPEPDPDVQFDSLAIEVHGLVKRFGDAVAVDRIDLTVRTGSFYGIVGPNGAGKTTTLSIIAGLLRPDAGTVQICGIDQHADPLAAKKALGVLPDRLRTFDRLTGRQLLHYYGLLRGLAPDVVEKRVADLARAFDLTGALNRVVSDYSAGMTKKIMLAGAMIHSPRVLVLDEPFESVDPVSSGVILDILRAYVAHGGTVVLSSHGMDLVEQVCSRVAIIVGGVVLAEGTVNEVRAGQTLAQRFVELSGSSGEVEGLEWLHAFSD